MAHFLKLVKCLRYFCLGLLVVVLLVILTSLILSFYINLTKNQKHWTPYPSVSLCQAFNNDKLTEISKVLYGDDKLNDYLTEAAFFTGACYTCEQCGTELNCPNLTEVVSQFRVKCDDLVQQCSWNDVKFNCCEVFMPLETISGICYSINTGLVHHKKGNDSLNHKHTFGNLKMKVLVDIQLFIHHPNDVPYSYHRRDLKEFIKLGSTKETTVEVIKLQQNETSKPNCRSSWNPGQIAVYDNYSKSTCLVNCHHKAQVNTCNCTHHLMPRNSNHDVPVCDMKGLKCLTENYPKLTEQLKTCEECMSSCEGFYDYNMTSSLQPEAEKEFTEISINILYEIK